MKDLEMILSMMMTSNGGSTIMWEQVSYHLKSQKLRESQYKRIFEIHLPTKTVDNHSLLS